MALYSHDTQGLGHIRRNSLVAAALVDRHEDVDVLLLTGAPEAAALPLPPRTSVVTLPALTKDRLGRYASRSLSPLQETIALRRDILTAALSRFDPDLLIVDKVPRGVLGELEPALRWLRSRARCRTVLGLRDVLDDVTTARREWEAAGCTSAIVELYDQVWVYGDPRVFDPATEYDWDPVVRRKVEYTGYLGHGRQELSRSSRDAPASAVDRRVAGPFVLCLVGGGQDGERLLRAFAGAPLPLGHTGVLVTGPYLDPGVRRELSAVVAQRRDLVLLEFVTDLLGLIRRAAASVSMGGYNSVCELLEAGHPILLVPRTTPRQEQAIRAARLREAGIVDVVDPGSLHPSLIGRWLDQAVLRRHVSHRADLDLDGFSRVCDLAESLMSGHTDELPEEGRHVAV